MSGLNDFQKFLTKHAGELHSLVNVITTLLPALPINPGDKAKVIEKLGDITAGADRIAASVSGVNVGGAGVTVKKSDVDAAVKAVLPVMVEAEIKRQLSLVKPDDLSGAIGEEVARQLALVKPERETEQPE